MTQRTRHGFPWHHFARYAPLVVIAGGIIGIAITGFVWSVRAFLHGALIAFCAYACTVLAEYLLHPWLTEKPEAWWRRALTYFFASQAGWPIGLFLGLPLIHGQPISSIRLPKAALFVIIVTSLAGPLMGIAVYGYEALKDRLRASIVQLKDKELADKELDLARQFQARMLPMPEIEGDGYRISARNLAARHVAGDFYDVFRYADGAVGIAVADVSGKGIASSLIMASVKAVLPLLAASREPSEALAALNEKLCGELEKRQFVAMSLVRYEPESGRLIVTNAGLPDPYIVDGDGSARAVEVGGPRLPIGLRRMLSYESVDTKLQPGESLVLFTDGLPEAISAAGEQLGYDELRTIISASRGSRVDEILQRVSDATGGGALDDDQTIVMLRRTSSPGGGPSPGASRHPLPQAGEGDQSPT